MTTDFINDYTSLATNITFYLYHSINLTAMFVRTFSISTAILCSTNSTNTMYFEVTFMQFFYMYTKRFSTYAMAVAFKRNKIQIVIFTLIIAVFVNTFLQTPHD